MSENEQDIGIEDILMWIKTDAMSRYCVAGAIRPTADWMKQITTQVGQVASTIITRGNVKDELVQLAAMAVAWISYRLMRGE